MTAFLTAFLLCAGTVFLLLAGVGVLRMPDLYCRMSATTKAATLGVGCILLAATFQFGDMRVATRAIATIAFLLLTVPVGAHMIGRAAFLAQVPLWGPTVCDELSKEYQANPRAAFEQDPTGRLSTVAPEHGIDSSDS